MSALRRLPVGLDPQLAQLAAKCIPAAVWMCSRTGGPGPQAAQEAIGLLQQLAQQLAAREGLVAAGAVAALSHHLGPAEGSLIQDRALQGLLLLCQGIPGACEQAVQAGCLEAAFTHLPQVGSCCLGVNAAIICQPFDAGRPASAIIVQWPKKHNGPSISDASSILG